MHTIILTLAVFATGASALSNKYLPPHQPSFGSFGSASIGQPSQQYLAPAASTSHFSFSGSSTGQSSYGGGVLAQPSRQYLAPAASTSHGISAGFSSGASSFGGNFGGSLTGGFGAASSGHGIVAKPSRQYLSPAASTSFDASTSFSSGGSTFGGHSSGPSFGGFGSATSSHGIVAQPSRQNLAPAASTSNGFSSGGTTFGRLGAATSGFGVVTHPSRQYLAPAASNSHTVLHGLSGTRYGFKGGYEYRHRF